MELHSLDLHNADEGWLSGFLFWLHQPTCRGSAAICFIIGAILPTPAYSSWCLSCHPPPPGFRADMMRSQTGLDGGGVGGSVRHPLSP